MSVFHIPWHPPARWLRIGCAWRTSLRMDLFHMFRSALVWQRFPNVGFRVCCCRQGFRREPGPQAWGTPTGSQPWGCWLAACASGLDSFLTRPWGVYVPADGPEVPATDTDIPADPSNSVSCTIPLAQSAACQSAAECWNAGVASRLLVYQGSASPLLQPDDGRCGTATFSGWTTGKQDLAHTAYAQRPARSHSPRELK